MSDLVKAVPLVNRNLMGLRPAQASLYKYMKKCADTQTTVSLEEVIKIYFYEVRRPHDPICPQCGHTSIFRQVSNINVLTMKDERNYGYFVEGPARHWMQATIGSLVMRGLLTVIPNFEVKIIEE
jgi:hypothetical protein